MPIIDRLTRRYARGLYLEAASRDEQQDVYRELDALAQALNAEPRLLMLLAHPAIEEQQKVEALVAGTGQLPTGGMRTETFLRLVLRKGREKVLRQISQAFLDEWDKDRGVVRAHVSSARQPTDEQLGQLRQTLSHLTGAAVELDSSTEPELIGGMTVRVGDRLVDGSLRGRLERLHRNIHRS